MKSKPKKYLILTSSGGGGHIAAAEARKAVLLKKGIPEEQIEIVDLMGIKKGYSDRGSWVPKITDPITGTVFFSGEENTRKWDELQKRGGIEAVRDLEKLVDYQWIAERIQANSVYQNMKQYLHDNDVAEIYNTQALSTPSLCQAIAEVNQEQGKELKMVGTVTEFLTHRAVHFLDPLSRISPKHRKVLEVEVVAPPLGGPGEDKEAFLANHNVDGITFKFLSEQGEPAPVKPEFLDTKYFKQKQIILKAKATAQGKELPEQEYVKGTLEASAEVAGDDFTIKKGPDDKLITITMGSQGSSTALAYVDRMIDQALLQRPAKSKGNVYMCIAAGKNDGRSSLYGKLRDHIEKRKEELKKQGKKLPDNLKIVPLAFQDGKHMASLLQNSDILVTRSGGMSSMEAANTQTNPTRKVYIHSEEKITSSNFPNYNYDAMYEELMSGTVKWEGGNAEYLMKHIGASLGSPETIDFTDFQREKSPDSLFHLAYNRELDQKHAVKIRQLIAEGSNPNLKLPDGSSLIDHCNDFFTTRLLVNHGATLTPKSIEKYSETEIIQLQQREQKFKESFTGKPHDSKIHEQFAEAIIKGNTRQVKGLLYHFDTIKNHSINTQGKTYLSPIQLAIEHDQLDVLTILLDQKAKINENNELGTALHYAINNGNAKAVEILLNHGADPKIKHKGKSSVSILEQTEVAPEIRKIFIRERLIKPAQYEADLMYESGNKYGNTQLHIAVYNLNHGKINLKQFEDILDKSAKNLNSMNLAKKSPLALCEIPEATEMLVKCGADISHVSKTPDIQKWHKEYKAAHQKMEELILAAARISKNSEEFTNYIKEKIVPGLPPAKEEEFKSTCTNLYDTLKPVQEKSERLSIVSKAIDKLKDLLGLDSFSKTIKSMAKESAKTISFTQKIEQARIQGSSARRVTITAKP